MNHDLTKSIEGSNKVDRDYDANFYGYGVPGPTCATTTKDDFRHFLLEWSDDSEECYIVRRAAGHMPPWPVYFQLVGLAHELWPGRADLEAKLIDALVAFFKHRGASRLTPLSRAWFKVPPFAERMECNGSLSFGHTHLREPPEFLLRLMPEGSEIEERI